MIDVNACYKIAFEALFENRSLEGMTEKVRDFIGASVLVLNVDGEILFYSSAMPGRKFQKARTKQFTAKVYDYVLKRRVEENPDFYRFGRQHMAVAKRIEVNGKLCGYSVIIFNALSPDVWEEYGTVADMLVPIVANYWTTYGYQPKGLLPMRKRLITHDIFCGNEGMNLKYLSDEIRKGYLMVYFPESEATGLVCKIREIWNKAYILEEEAETWVLFYQIENKKEEKLILDRLKKEVQLPCCVSILFQDIENCHKKVKWLKRIDSLDEYDKADNMMRESEWRAETVYTYAYPVLAEAGIKDYSLQILQQEDEENNTELYETLKMYFLCAHNVVETANALHIHRNTLIYRLKKIRELIGDDIEDVKKSEELLALMMMNSFARTDGRRVE